MAAVSNRGEGMEGQPFPWLKFCEIPFENPYGVIIPELVLATAPGTSTCGGFLGIAHEEDYTRLVIRY
jgi:hypothetical protein